MKRASRLLAAGLLLAPLLSGCGTARRGVAATGREVEADDPELLRGRAVFTGTCQPCHPGGEAGLGPALNNKPLPGFLIRLQVRAGFGAMPSFSREELPPEDLGAIVAWLKALRRSGR